jgi:ABC-type lipoprotein release transport system permease subunit
VLNFLMALRNIRRNIKKSLAALATVIAAFMSLSLFQSYIDQVKDIYLSVYSRRGMLGDIIIESKTADKRLELADQKKIENILDSTPEISPDRVRFLRIDGTISNGESESIFMGLAYDVEAGRKRRAEWEWNTLAGEPLHAKPNGLILGRNLGKNLDCVLHPDVKNYKIGFGQYLPSKRPTICTDRDFSLNVTTFNGQANAIDIPLAGITDVLFKDLDQRYIAVSLPVGQRLMDTESISYYGIAAKKKSEIPQALGILKEKMSEEKIEASVMPWTEHKMGEMYKRTMSLLKTFRNFVVLILLSIASLSVFSLFLRIIAERVHEIGTLRSMGFKSRSVVLLFMTESGLITFTGCALGSALSVAFIFVANNLKIYYKAGVLSEPVPFAFSYNLDNLWTSFLVLFFLSLVSSVLPLWRVLKKSVADNLSYVP